MARGDRVPALGDGAGEEGDAEGLEHAPRHPRLLALALRDLPDALGRDQLDPLVHAELDRPWFLGFIVSSSPGSLALLFLRLPLLRSKTKLESLVSREATFLYNNLLLVAFCLTILWGVLFPILSEAVRGESVTVGRPYYDFFLRTLRPAAALLMGIGPLVAWRRASLRSLGRHSRWPAAVALVTGAAARPLGAAPSLPGLIAYTFSAFVLGSIVLEFVRGTRRGARSASRAGCAFGSLVARNRRRYGGYVVHAAIVLLAIGIAGSSAYQTATPAKLRPGPDAESAGHAHLPGQARRPPERGRKLRAPVDVSAAATASATLAPGKNVYPVEQQVSNDGDPPRLAASLEDLARSPTRSTRRRRRLLEGARQAARQPDLDRRLRLRARLADRAVAGRARAAAPRGRYDEAGPCRRRVTTVALALGAVLAVAVVLAVARRSCAEPTPGGRSPCGARRTERRRLELAEERDRALAALKELEFDHRTGKVSDEDYRALVGPLRRHVAEALRALDARAQGAGDRIA